MKSIQTLKKSNDTTVKLLLAVAIITFAILFRLAPLPPNFAPITAIAIFGGAIMPRRWALSLPLVAMLLTDMVLGYHSLIWVTWGSFFVITLMCNKYMKQINTTTVVGSSISASIFFFITTNFAVWVEGRLYPPTLEGLISSYYNALPFFRNSLVSSLVFTSVLVGAYALVYRYVLYGKTSLRVADAISSR